MVERAAGFWRRFGSALVDGVIVTILGGVLRLLHVPGFERTHDGVEVWAIGGSDLSLLLTLVYFTSFHGRTGRTPGNALLGIRVVDLRSPVERPLGYRRAALRCLVSILSGLVFAVGYLWMLWDPQRQTWHDKAARSLPIYERGLPPPAEPALDEGWADRLVG